MRLLVLTVTVLVSVTEARRAARVSSIWDVILGTDTRDKHQALASNVVNTHQAAAKGVVLKVKLCNVLQVFSLSPQEDFLLHYYTTP